MQLFFTRLGQRIRPTTETYYRSGMILAILAIYQVARPGEAGSGAVVFTTSAANALFLAGDLLAGAWRERFFRYRGWVSAWDILTITALMWTSGGVDSPYVPLMYIVIGASGIRAYRHSGFLAAIGALAAVGAAGMWAPDHVGSEEVAAITGADAVTFLAFGMMADLLAHAFIYQQRQQVALMHNMVESLAAAVDSKDAYTYGHSRRVQHYALLIGEHLRLSPKELTTLRFASLLHDIGKIHVPTEILHKPGRLTENEWAVIKEHPAAGAYILSHTPELADVAQAVAHHHERWDGRGYPGGLQGEQIPLLSRIILAADAFDAMTSRRAYGPGRTAAEALDELHNGRGSQFDPAVVDAIDSLVRAGRWPVSDEEFIKAG